MSYRVKANWLVRDSGKKYPTGTEFQTDDKGLIDCGAVEALDTAAAAPGAEASDENETSKDNQQQPSGSDAAGTDGTLSAGDRLQAITDQLAKWLENDPEQKSQLQWTKSKKPKLAVLNKALGFDVSVAEVHPIFDALIKQD